MLNICDLCDIFIRPLISPFVIITSTMRFFPLNMRALSSTWVLRWSDISVLVASRPVLCEVPLHEWVRARVVTFGQICFVIFRKRVGKVSVSRLRGSLSVLHVLFTLVDRHGDVRGRRCRQATRQLINDSADASLVLLICSVPGCVWLRSRNPRKPRWSFGFLPLLHRTLIENNLYSSCNAAP